MGTRRQMDGADLFGPGAEARDRNHALNIKEGMEQRARETSEAIAHIIEQFGVSDITELEVREKDTYLSNDRGWSPIKIDSNDNIIMKTNGKKYRVWWPLDIPMNGLEYRLATKLPAKKKK